MAAARVTPQPLQKILAGSVRMTALGANMLTNVEEC
jgi:hypothetical protein